MFPAYTNVMTPWLNDNIMSLFRSVSVCVSSPPAVLPKSELRKDFFCIFTEFKGWEPFDINSKTNWPSQNEGYLNAMFFAGLIF